MNHTIFFLTFTYFCIILQSCMAMEKKQNELQLIKQLSTIKTDNSIVTYLTNETIVSDDTKGLYLIDIDNEKTTPIKTDINCYSKIAIHPNKSQIVFTINKHPDFNFAGEFVELYDIVTKKKEDLTWPNVHNPFSIITLAFNPHNNDVFTCHNIPSGRSIKNLSQDHFHNNNNLTDLSNNTNFLFHPQKNLLYVIQSGFISIYNPNNLTIKPEISYIFSNNARCQFNGERCQISSEGIIAITEDNDTAISIIDINNINQPSLRYILSKKIHAYLNIDEKFDHILFYPKSSILITVSQKASLEFWNTTNSQLIYKTPLSHPTDDIMSVSPDGKKMIIRSNNTYGEYAIPEEVRYESIKRAVYSLCVLKNYSNCHQTLPTDIIKYILSLYWDTM